MLRGFKLPAQRRAGDVETAARVVDRDAVSAVNRRLDTQQARNERVALMLLSRTRRDGDFALTCWDCFKNKIEELQILPGPGEPKFDAPGRVPVRKLGEVQLPQAWGLRLTRRTTW